MTVVVGAVLVAGSGCSRLQTKESSMKDIVDKKDAIRIPTLTWMATVVV